ESDIFSYKLQPAKGKVKNSFPSDARISGVGITRKDGHYALKVNLEEESSVALPEEIEGVAVVVHVVGKVRKQN
ncbi:MAG: hypothetical protein AAB353_12565, partial [Candidatus Hydrogenedentota bacterium]